MKVLGDFDEVAYVVIVVAVVITIGIVVPAVVVSAVVLAFAFFAAVVAFVFAFALLDGDKDGLNTGEESGVQTFIVIPVVVVERDLGLLSRNKSRREVETGVHTEAVGEVVRVAGRARVKVEEVRQEGGYFIRGERRLHKRQCAISH